MTIPVSVYLKWLLTLTLCVCLQQLSAQSGEPAPFKRFGFQAGMNMSNMNFNLGSPPPPTPDAASWKPGITFGFLLRVPLAKNLFLQPEYAYTGRSGSDKSLGIDYHIDYISMPVLLNYRLSSRFAVLAGPQLEMLIDARSTSQGVSTGITHDVEERGVSLTGGFEFNIARLFFLSARYLQGLNHIGIGQRSNPKEFKYEALQLTAGVRF